MPQVESSPTVSIAVEPDTFHVKASRRPTLSAGLLSRKLPNPCSCLVSRVLHGMWFLNLVTMQPSERATGVHDNRIKVTLSAPRGRRLVLVSLADGERLAFNLGYLVAFSANMKLGTEVELSWSAFGCEKNFIQQAEGPGNMVFELSGEESFGGEGSSRFAPSRLVAWDPTAKFAFTGIGGIGDIYLNEVMVRVTDLAAKPFVLLDADDDLVHGGASNLGRIWRLVKRVYVPL